MNDINSLRAPQREFACPNLKYSISNSWPLTPKWDEFITYDWQNIYDSMQKPAFIFDGRNLLNAADLVAIGFVYQAVGS